MEEDNDLVEGVSTQNESFANASALQIRLDTNPILQQIEFFLRGKELNDYFDKETQSYRPQLVDSGRPKANRQGIQAILNRCRGLINSQVVQGNLKTEHYQDFIYWIRVELAELLTINFWEWQLKSDSDVEEISDNIVNFVELFITRTIDNKERDSYGMKTVETSRNYNEKKGLFG